VFLMTVAVTGGALATGGKHSASNGRCLAYKWFG
jgi:hypothetical protein